MQVIDDPDAERHSKDVRRLIFCSGKIAIDLLTSPLRQQATSIAICRVEQVYPLPVRDMLEAIERFPKLDDVLWVQEEPENMGAWEFVRPSLEGLAGTRRAGRACAAAQLEPRRGIGRPARAEPGTAHRQRF